MSLSRYFVGEKKRQESGSNPFQWAKSVGEERSSDVGDVEASVFDGDAIGPSDSSDVAPELNETVGLNVDRGWIGRVLRRSERKPIGVTRRDIGEIKVKRNDLWESDWDVHVAQSDGLGIESDPGLRPAKVGLLRRLWGRLTVGVVTEGRKVVDL